MNKVTKKIIRSLLLSSALLLVNTNAKSQNQFLPEYDSDEDDTNEVGEIKRKIFNKVIKISPKGRMTMVDSHRSHSSHRSHYSGGGGHSSHSSHYSSSHTSHYSSSSRTSRPSTTSTPTPKPKKTTTSPTSSRSSTTTSPSQTSGFYSAPATKSPYESSLGERSISKGLYGMDIDELVRLLTAAGFPPDSTKLEHQSSYLVFNDEIAMAVKMFQAYNKLEVTGIPDTMTIKKLRAFKK